MYNVHAYTQVGLVDGSLGTIFVHRVSVDLPIEIEWNTSADFKLPDSGKHHHSISCACTCIIIILL